MKIVKYPRTIDTREETNMQKEHWKNWNYIVQKWEQNDSLSTFEQIDELIYLIKNGDIEDVFHIIFDQNEHLLFFFLESAFTNPLSDLYHRISFRENFPEVWLKNILHEDLDTIPQENWTQFRLLLIQSLLKGSNQERLSSNWDKIIFQTVSEHWDQISFDTNIVQYMQREVFVESGFSWRNIHDNPPEHRVYIPHGLQVMSYPVCNHLYGEISRKHPWKNATPIRKRKPLAPAINLRWLDCIYFANALSREYGYQEAYSIHQDTEEVSWNEYSTGFRLLTEAEWWHCMSGGNYKTIERFQDDFGYFRSTSGKNIFPIGQKSPNIYGICDFYGHICEWVWDRSCEIYAYMYQNFSQITQDFYQFQSQTFLEDGFAPSDIPSLKDKHHKKFDISILEEARLDPNLFLKNPTGSNQNRRPRIRMCWKKDPDNFIFGLRSPLFEKKAGPSTGFRLVRTVFR